MSSENDQKFTLTFEIIIIKVEKTSNQFAFLKAAVEVESGQVHFNL